MSVVAVSRLVRRYRATVPRDELLDDAEPVLAENADTGHAVNVPIAETCWPTKACAATCYAATGYNAHPDAMARQARVLRTLERDPIAFAERVVREYRAAGLDFLRWNGVGDLTAPAVDAINHVGRAHPDVTLWVVTRRPDTAARVEHAPRVFLHSSVDEESVERVDAFLRAAPRSDNFFFSYQASPSELPDFPRASVLFLHRYRLVPWMRRRLDPATLCPLNGADDVRNTCARCRRCFDGSAVEHRRNTL